MLCRSREQGRRPRATARGMTSERRDGFDRSSEGLGG